MEIKNSEVMATDTPVYPDTNTEAAGNALQDLCLPTAETVKLIFEAESEFRSNLEQLTKTIADLTKSIKPASSLKISDDYLPGASDLKEHHLETNQSLAQEKKHCNMILQPNKVCLTVCRYKGRIPIWKYKKQAISHLRSLFPDYDTPIDLISTELLTSTKQVQRLSLNFNSAKMPAKILQQKTFLATRGIFP